ncbi:hypothetical protein DL767_003784 [Monosporascus sp. MG133]|nr:hypothetical protein DL767_003784 [Monosporascus sp. MG133]
MATSSLGSRRASWASDLRNGTQALHDPSQDDGDLKRMDDETHQAEGAASTGQGQQPASTPGPDHHLPATTCRHGLGSHRCLSHSNYGSGFPPGTEQAVSDHSPANGSRLRLTFHSRSRSLPPALEAYIQDAQSHEQAACGISSRGLGGSEANHHHRHRHHHHQHQQTNGATTLFDDFVMPAGQANTETVLHSDHEDTRGVGRWCSSSD